MRQEKCRWKEKLKNPLIQQYLLEIALPIVGYFFFDWSITIIAVFYLVDYLSAEIARNRRVYKVYKNTTNASSNGFIVSMMVGGFFFALSTAWTWWNFEEKFSNSRDAFYNELINFAREELWILLPLVFFVYHVKDIMTFYAPRRFMKRDYRKMVKFQLVEIMILTILILSGTFCWRYFEISDVVAIISFIVLKIGFDILVTRTLDAHYILD